MKLDEIGIRICTRTLRRLARKHHIRSYKIQEKPKLDYRKALLRLTFANKYLNEPIDWREVLFVDEKIYSISSFDREEASKYIKCLKAERYLYSNIRGRLIYAIKGIKVWACFGYYGCGQLYFDDGNMNAKLYSEIIKGPLLNSIRKLKLKCVLQDNETMNLRIKVKLLGCTVLDLYTAGVFAYYVSPSVLFLCMISYFN
jgi:hypothetical protein